VRDVQLVLVLVFFAVLVATFAERIRAPAPSVLVLAGVGIEFLPAESGRAQKRSFCPPDCLTYGRYWDGRQRLVRRRSWSTEDPVNMGSRPESEASPYGLRRGQTTLDMCRRGLNRSLSADAA